MRIEPVEIYSDETNAAIMRHPDRRFPGMLIQGDTLHNLSRSVVAALADATPDSEQYWELKYLADDLCGRVELYRHVLVEHGMECPFFDPRSS